MKCSSCSNEHDLDDLEVGFDLPDEVFAIPKSERTTRARFTPDLCILDGTRYFLRGVLPIPCSGHDAPFGLGLWVETTKQAYERYVVLYSDPGQGNEPRFGATIANAVDGYWDLLGVLAEVQLISAEDRPRLYITDTSHPAARDQMRGITETQAFEILFPYLHPELPDTQPN